MLAAVKGIIRGNTVVIEDEDMKEYEGARVIVTLLDVPEITYTRSSGKAPIDWDSFVIPSERGKDVDAYMKEMRDGDRV